MNPYIGHSLQLAGVEEFRLTGGLGDGMRMLSVRNGKGLSCLISMDRCADLMRVEIDGVNMGYFAGCGHVHPAYYEKDGISFLKSFTAGFMTTCGLAAVGSPCEDEGEVLGLHGTISNIPAENHSWEETEDEIIIKAQMRDARLFARRLLLSRVYRISKITNTISMEDTVTNIGSAESPVMLLYHCNMGYPLLSENAQVVVPANSVLPRAEYPADAIPNCLNMEKPQAGYEEQCFYHDVKETNSIAKCGIYNPDIEKGMVMSFDKRTLDCFTEWKMMGAYDYVLGLEPGNCRPDGRDVMRKDGTLKFVAPGENYKTSLSFDFKRDKASFDGAF